MEAQEMPLRIQRCRWGRHRWYFLTGWSGHFQCRDCKRLMSQTWLAAFCRLGLHRWRVWGEGYSDPDLWRKRTCTCCRREQLFVAGLGWKTYKKR